MAEEVTGEKKTLDLSSEMPAIEGVETDEELLLGLNTLDRRHLAA